MLRDSRETPVENTMPEELFICIGEDSDEEEVQKSHSCLRLYLA